RPPPDPLRVSRRPPHDCPGPAEPRVHAKRAGARRSFPELAQRSHLARPDGDAGNPPAGADPGPRGEGEAGPGRQLLLSAQDRDPPPTERTCRRDRARTGDPAGRGGITMTPRELYRAGRLTEALSAADGAVEQAPDDPETRAFYAELLLFA